MQESTKLHPFEAAGMGRGPYAFIGAWSFPSPSLAEQNPTAYQNALAMMPRGLVNGCGTCANCGRSIMNVCIVRDADGARYGVGCDCIEKTDDPSIGRAASIAVAKLDRAKRRDAAARRRAAKHAAWLAEVDPATGETREARMERERAEGRAAADAREAEAKAAADARCGFMLPALDASGSFGQELARSIRGGSVPYGRGLVIACEIYARSFGRGGSKAFVAAFDDAAARCGLES